MYCTVRLCEGTVGQLKSNSKWRREQSSKFDTIPDFCSDSDSDPRPLRYVTVSSASIFPAKLAIFSDRAASVALAAGNAKTRAFSP